VIAEHRLTLYPGSGFTVQRMDGLRISELAAQAGVPTSTVRYYERVGLLPVPERSSSGYRTYDDRAEARLLFITRGKRLGLSLDEIAELVAIWDGTNCGATQERLSALLAAKRVEIADRIRELEHFADQLADGILLAIATLFFVWGALAEQSGHHDEAQHNTSTKSESSGSGETSEQHADEQANATSSSGETQGESEYRPFGINLESSALIVIAALVSIALAGLVAFHPSRPALVAVVILAAAFTALEIAEVIHQADADKPGLLTLAAIAGTLHAAAGLVALFELVLAPRAAPPALAQ
jgi:DNA-binding transcriptional MerR regulator